MLKHPTSVAAIFASLSKNRALILALSKREVIGRYRGSVMGIAWSFFNPILMLTVYTFVFGVVFQSRWGGPQEESKINFSIVLFVGMIVHGLFSECVNRAPLLILSNVNYVKKVIFPLEILPIVAMGSTLFHSFVSTCILLIALLISQGDFPLTAVYFPIIILPLIIGTMGVAWFLASIGVFFRDVAQTTGIITTVLMFLSPIFYPASSLPAPYQTFLYLNPLTFIIEESRGALIFGRAPNWLELFLYFCISVLIAGAGFSWFQKTRKGFADVL